VRFQAILFDLDGTLVDSHREITLALSRALEELGLTLPFHEAGALVDGRTLEHIWEVRLAELLPAPARARGFSAFADAYRAHYMADLGHATNVFPDVLDTLRALRASVPAPKLAVVSNKAGPSVPALLARFGLTGYFELMLGAGGSGHAPKPSPALLLHAATTLGVPPDRCLMVGDTELDVHAGRAAGMTTLALSYGMGSYAELADADVVLPSFGALRNWLSSTTS
jgi:phosphoglycolate phosphatase